MDNATRRQLLQRHKMSGFPGSIMDVFQAYEQGVDLIDQYQQQQQMQVAQTPQQRQQGLRPAHQAGNTNASMAFPNTKPNASFNTVGMKAPIDMKQFDSTGNLVKSYDAVPPGVTDLKMSSKGGTVIETPAQMQYGGIRKYQDGSEYVDPDTPRVGDMMFGMYPGNVGPTNAGRNSDRLDYRVAEELASRKGGEPEMYLAMADTIAYHESGPHQRMGINAWQNNEEDSPGKGAFQNEGTQYGGSGNLETTQNHLNRTMGYWGESLPDRIANATDASTLSYEDQRALALAHFLQGPVPMADFASGKLTTADVWAKGWKKKKPDMDSFEESRASAAANGIPRTNYVERKYGGNYLRRLNKIRRK